MAQYDGSYADRRTYGFNVDIANGFATPVPTLILYAAYSVDLIPALAAGNHRSDAVLAIDLHDVGLLGQLLRSRSAIADQPA